MSALYYINSSGAFKSPDTEGGWGDDFNGVAEDFTLDRLQAGGSATADQVFDALDPGSDDANATLDGLAYTNDFSNLLVSALSVFAPNTELTTQEEKYFNDQLKVIAEMSKGNGSLVSANNSNIIHKGEEATKALELIEGMVNYIHNKDKGDTEQKIVDVFASVTAPQDMVTTEAIGSEATEKGTDLLKDNEGNSTELEKQYNDEMALDAEFEEKILELDEDIDNLDTEIRNLKNGYISEEEIEDLEDEIEVLEDEIEILEDEYGDSDALDELEDELDELEDELDELEDELYAEEDELYAEENMLGGFFPSESYI